MDDDRVDVGDVETGLNDGGRDQDIQLAADELIHDLLELALVHSAVGKGDPGLRHELLELRSDKVDVVDRVVDIVDLTAPAELSEDGLPHELIVVLHDVGLDRLPVLGCLLKDAHVPDADKAHVECARDRGRRQRQHVHVFAQLFDLLLVTHAKALLLIDDEKSQVLELHPVGEELVGSDHDVYRAVRKTFQDLCRLRRRAEAREQLNVHREVLHPLQERVVVLLGEDCRGHEHRHLAVILHRLKGGPQGDLRLAKAHIAADQPVHDPVRLHILLRVCNRIQLVLGLLVGEHLLKLPLPDGIRREGVSLLLLPLCVQLHQVLSDLLHGVSDPLPCRTPVIRAEGVELWPWPLL